MGRQSFKQMVDEAGGVGSDFAKPDAYQRDGGRAWCALLIIQIANFGMNASFTVLTLAMPRLATFFHSSEDIVVWVTLGPMILSATLAPACGWFADRYGRKPLWLLGMAINVVALVLSGLASSIGMLIAGRCLQGIGQGADGPSGFALTIAAFSKERRGRVLGIMEALRAVAPSTGIVLGGLLLDRAGWRFLFLAPLPLVVLSALVMRCHAMPSQAMPCSALLCSAKPCDAMPCDAMRCYALLGVRAARPRAASGGAAATAARPAAAGRARRRLIASHRIASHRTAPHRTAPHRIASHRTAPHRTAPHRTAPHSTAQHSIA
jgi:MFS family permease